MADSNRSAHCPASPTMRPRNAACSKDNQGEYILTTKAKSTDPINPAKAPSIVFFGDICGAILRFPNARPTKKAAVSLLHVHPNTRIVTPKPCSRLLSSRRCEKPPAIQTTAKVVIAKRPTRCSRLEAPMPQRNRKRTTEKNPPTKPSSPQKWAPSKAPAAPRYPTRRLGL